jgi:hypothetical protein
MDWTENGIFADLKSHFQLMSPTTTDLLVITEAVTKAFDGANERRAAPPVHHRDVGPIAKHRAMTRRKTRRFLP